MEVKQLGNIMPTKKRDNPNQGRVYDTDGLAPALTNMSGGGREPMIAKKGRIRKLTPRECWRLFHFTDQDFEKAQKVNSNTQLYKQAGNSVPVTFWEAIFRQLNIQGISTWNEERRKYEEGRP